MVFVLLFCYLLLVLNK